MSAIRSMFSGTGEAQASVHGTRFAPGFNGTLEIRKALAKRSQKTGADLFIVELAVVSCDDENEYPRGAERVWIQSFIDRNTAQSAIKGFLMACYRVQQSKSLDYDFNPFVDVYLEQFVCSELNDLQGVIVDLETATIITQKKKEEFLLHKWRPFYLEGYRPPKTWEHAKHKVTQYQAEQGFILNGSRWEKAAQRVGAYRQWVEGDTMNGHVLRNGVWVPQ